MAQHNHYQHGYGIERTLAVPKHSPIMPTVQWWLAVLVLCAPADYARTATVGSSGGSAAVPSKKSVAIGAAGEEPPDSPNLNFPADGATGIPAAALLGVHISDPDTDLLDVTFYGRLAEPEENDRFTIIQIPDSQYYAQNFPAIFMSQTAWIVANRDVLNIRYVAHCGDVVNVASQISQWVNADAAMAQLEDAATTTLEYGIPYGVLPGNHDQSPLGDPDGTAYFNNWFGVNRFVGRDYYGGHYPLQNNDNNYGFFRGSGMDFIVVSFEYDPTPDSDVLAWADSLLKTYSHHRAILVGHYFMNIGDGAPFSTQGQMTYNALKANPNLFLMLCGHRHGEGRRIDVYQGQTVYTLLANYQGLANGGDGWLRILEFSKSGNVINVTTYSPWLDEYGSDAVMGSNTTSAEFTLPYNMVSGEPFHTIGTLTSIVQNSDVSITWPGRAAGMTYEWYVDVSDGISTTSSAVWTFTSDGTCSATVDCDDGMFCNGSETCPFDGGVCTPGTEPCLSGELCNEATDTCVDCLEDVDCDDGNPCNGAEWCAAGLCVPGIPVDCSALDDECNVGECLPTTGLCEPRPAHEGWECSDGLACTSRDTCVLGTCVGHDDCLGGRFCDSQTGACELAPVWQNFQEEVDGYTGTVDTFLRQSAPLIAEGSREWVEWDASEGSTGQETLALIRFDSLFGAGAGQIPLRATVQSAMLTLDVRNVGQAGELCEVLADWDESTTYATFGDDGTQADAYGPPILSIPGGIGLHTIDVTTSVQAWIADPAGNRGWIVLPTGTDGVEAWSSEAATMNSRPRLAVLYLVLSTLTGDVDDDGDVDDADYRSFADCLSGPGAAPEPQAASLLECMSTFDFDRDGDVDLADACSFTQLFTGRVTPGDFDDDGDVDLTDYTMFSACMAGPGASPPPLSNDIAERCLLVFDRDRDNDVDLLDFGGFQALFTASGS